MKLLIGISLSLITFSSCTSSETKNQTMQNENDLVSGKYKNRIYSPDKTKYIEIFKNGSMKGDAITQVYIHYPHGASEIYSCKGIDKDIKVEWSTASEINNDRFDILVSADGKNFSSLTLINSLSESGFSTRRLDYNYIDYNAIDKGNVLYYQLKQSLLMEYRQKLLPKPLR